MKRMLRKIDNLESAIWYFENGERKEGKPSWLRGDVTRLRGDVTRLSGDVTWLSGNVTGLRGDVTGLSGNVDACELSAEERKNGVKVNDLLLEKEK